MTTATIPFGLPGFLCHEVKVVDTGIELEAEATRRYTICPACGFRSTSIHSHYLRRIHDLPLNGKAMHLRLRVRRFRCRNSKCLQQIFTERIPEIALPSARRCTRLNEVLRQLGLALGGEAGSRLARQLQITVSGDTVLRILRQTTFNPVNNPKVVGIDDWV